jgi:hypothetical protein
MVQVVRWKCQLQLPLRHYSETRHESAFQVLGDVPVILKTNLESVAATPGDCAILLDSRELIGVANATYSALATNNLRFRRRSGCRATPLVSALEKARGSQNLLRSYPLLDYHSGHDQFGSRHAYSLSIRTRERIALLSPWGGHADPFAKTGIDASEYRKRTRGREPADDA